MSLRAYFLQAFFGKRELAGRSILNAFLERLGPAPAFDPVSRFRSGLGEDLEIGDGAWEFSGQRSDQSPAVGDLREFRVEFDSQMAGVFHLAGVTEKAAVPAQAVENPRRGVAGFLFCAPLTRFGLKE